MSTIDSSYSTPQVRSLLRLSRRLQDLTGVDERREFLLHALCEATGATSGFGMLLDDGMQSVGEVTSVCFSAQRGAAGGDPVEVVQLEGSNQFFGLTNPMTRPFLETFAGRLMEPTALSRRDIVSDADWYESQYFARFRQPAGLDDCIICIVPLPGNKSFLSAVCLNRALKPSDGIETDYFSAAECDAAELIHAELRWACVEDASKVETWETDAVPPQLEVAPRLRRVLLRMLAGDSEKQIASALGLSRHTIHEYIRALYRELSVSSRAELMAKFVTLHSLSA